MGAKATIGRILPTGVRLAVLYVSLAEGSLHTAAALAATTGSGQRTVYRDIRRLRAAGLGIEGTPRLGYRLAGKPELRPLFLTRPERAALAAAAPAGLKSRLRAL